MTDTRVVVLSGPRGPGIADALAGREAFAVETVASPEAVLDRLADGSADCLVVEHGLAEGDALALLERVRERSDVPFVLVATDGSERLASDAVAAGADAYVPLGPDGLSPAALADRVASTVADAEVVSRGRRQYETIVETVPDGVFVLDEDAVVVGGNENAARMLGYESVSAVVGTPVPQLVADGVFGQAVVEEYVDIVPDLLSSSTDRQMGRFEFDVTVDGEERIYQASVALRPYDEEFRGTIGILRDITDRREREEELEQYETIIEVIPDAVWAMDDDLTYTFVNESMVDLSGYERGESGDEGARIGMTEAGYRRGAEAVSELWNADDPAAESVTFEHDIVRKDGRALTCETHLALLPFDGEFRGIAGITRDITDRKRRTRRLEVLNRILRHNLRNDLTTVIEYADLIDHETDSAAIREHAATVRETAYGLVDASDQIRQTQQALEDCDPEASTVDLARLVEQVAAGQRERFPHATIRTDVHGSVVVRGSEILGVAVANLVGNAVEHHDRDDPTVTVETRPATDPPLEVVSDSVEPTDWVELRVVDDGPGIPEHEREVVSGDEVVSQLTHSSGVGLWLVDWVVSTFGGRMRIEDNDPRGSVVVCALQRASS